MENRKQLKAQLTNEISKRYQGRIKKLKDSRNALRTKIEIERNQFRELQEKYLNLAQEFESLKDWNTRLMEFMDGIYYIENTVSECRSSISGYFKSLDEAIEALKECSDWYCSKGTGCIYFKKFGLKQKRQLVYRK